MNIEKDRLTLARTIYGEARGEYTSKTGGLASLIAVGNVILNRSRSPMRFGQGIHRVCTRPYQFSCWNPNDPNRQKIATLQMGENKIFNLCFEVANQLIHGHWPDLTKSSNHYHAPLPSLPKWAVGQRPQIKIGQHVFYKL